ncbi:MAG: hypothetical protein EXS32_04690 [Opitutus sp.]|nr:hypothetical protein [Opitutus sp.]
MKTRLFVVAGVVTVVALVVAWRSAAVIREREAARDQLRQQIDSARSRGERLRERLARAETETARWSATRAAAKAPVTRSAGAVDASGADRGAAPDWPALLARFREDNRSPYLHLQRLATLRQDLPGDEPLLRALGLSPAQIDQFNKITAACAEKHWDYQAIAAAAIVPANDSTLAKLKAQADAEKADALRELAGDAIYPRLREHQRTENARKLAKSFAATEAMAGATVPPVLLAQLVQVIANGSASYLAGQPVSQNDIDWGKVGAQVRPMLSDAQWASFQSDRFIGAYRDSQRTEAAIRKAVQDAGATANAKPPGS